MSFTDNFEEIWNISFKIRVKNVMKTFCVMSNLAEEFASSAMSERGEVVNILSLKREGLLERGA